MRTQIKALVINGYKMPAHDEGFAFTESTYGKFERNAKNQVIGDKVGRPLIKMELQWSSLTPEQWKDIKEALSPFFVKVTFTDDTNVRRTMTMYPSDRKSTPKKFDVTTNTYKEISNAKLNLIDCGWDD